MRACSTNSDTKYVLHCPGIGVVLYFTFHRRTSWEAHQKVMGHMTKFWANHLAIFFQHEGHPRASVHAQMHPCAWNTGALEIFQLSLVLYFTWLYASRFQLQQREKLWQWKWTWWSTWILILPPYQNSCRWGPANSKFFEKSTKRCGIVFFEVRAFQRYAVCLVWIMSH